jgi:hypothetical protein
MPRFRSPHATLVRRTRSSSRASASAAQEAGAKPAQGPQAERPAAAEPEGPQVPWLTGPMQGNLGVLAHVQVKDGCGFADDDGTRLFLTRTQNPDQRQRAGHGHLRGRSARPATPRSGSRSSSTMTWAT